MNRPAAGNGHFFNDLGKQTSTLPPWAQPAGGAVGGRLAAPFGGYGGSQSSTKPPGGVAPIGNPQLPRLAGANADPNAQGGNSGIVGFGAIDYFNGDLSPNVGPPQGAAPVGGGTGNQNSGEQNGVGFYGVGGGGMDMGPGLIAGGGFNQRDMQDKSNTKEVSGAAASASTIVGVVVAVLIVIGIFALVAVFLVRQRRNSRVVIGSV